MDIFEDYLREHLPTRQEQMDAILDQVRIYSCIKDITFY